MKRWISILTGVVLLALLLGGCAEKSARDRLMMRYDQIKPTAAMLAMPGDVQKTVKAYNEQRYYDAAIGFYAILKNPEQRALHESAQYYLTECLYRLKIYQACQYELTKILFKGPEGSTYFTSALVKLLAITYETKDETVVFAVLSNIPLEKFPKMFRNELIYLVGKMYFYNGQVDEAYTKFTQVNEGSAFYAKANYFKGIIEVQRKDYSKAKETFDLVQSLPPVAAEYGETEKVKEMSKQAIGQLFYAAAHDATDDNRREEIFKTAIRYYDQVDRENPQWFEAQFEKTWAATMIGQFGVSLGVSLTLSSPYFEHRFVPEIKLIEAITWYNLCKYTQARSTIDSFIKSYEDMYTRVKAYVVKMNGARPSAVYEDLLDQYEAAFKGERTDLPIQVLTHVLNDQKFLNNYAHIKELEVEFERMDKTPAAFKATDFFKSTTKKMNLQRANIKKKAGRWSFDELKDVESMLSELLGSAKQIDFELSDAERKVLEEKDRYNLGFREAINANEAELLTPAVPDAYQYWPFQGEYWKDELGYYLLAVQRECQ